ncbi:hypothetical protein Pcinc_018073 [Petrolisthes cinctipes]|uniref:RNA-binding protein MEX3B n=1 Tax=Petrolisthes cinctipes TaxID=88211 RepID=A0AAE1KJQ6_PETCI|nr:hypothetical protein Pcinc_018073 [Petrolisthes cinctipes]
MPASSLFAEMERPTPTPSSTSAMDEQRALQLALELSLIGLNNESPVTGTNEPEHYAAVVQGLDPGERAGNTKRSQNMTECVAVPSSEHVAEIVGRQGVCASAERRVGPLCLPLLSFVMRPRVCYVSDKPSDKDGWLPR